MNIFLAVFLKILKSKKRKMKQETYVGGLQIGTPNTDGLPCIQNLPL